MYNIVQECVLCGKPIKGSVIIEQIDGKPCAFDSENCALVFKRFRSVYGSDFLTDVIGQA
jgi:hypothetical protein